ncbi:hypothetical protein ACTHGU_12005 [Chitinophagaceae bacterium MMS25-I14]
MYSNTVRIILIIIGALVAIFFASVGFWLQMGAALAFVLLIVLGYFLNGAVFLAFRKLSKNDFEQAEKLLDMTKYPQYLGRSQKAYYYFTRACIEGNKGNLQPAATAFETAIKTGLRTQNDTAVALLNLATINYNLGEKSKAKKYLQSLKQVTYNAGLQPEIDKLNDLLGA